jgi:hypothetical protein
MLRLEHPSHAAGAGLGQDHVLIEHKRRAAPAEQLLGLELIQQSALQEKRGKCLAAGGTLTDRSALTFARMKLPSRCPL